MTKRLHQSPEHDADHGEADEDDNGCGVALEIASEAVIAADPGKSSLDNPSLGQDLEVKSEICWII
jgi:hypothetical protein